MFMSRLLPILILLLGLAGLGWWSSTRVAPVIQDKVAQNTQTALEGNTRHDVMADVSGRDITVTGIAHDDAERAAILERLNAVDGRRVIVDSMTLLPSPESYTFSVSKTEDGTLTGTGFAPDQAAADAIRAQLPDAQITIGAGEPTSDWSSAITGGVAALSQLKKGTLEVEGTTLTLSGDPVSIDSAQDIAATPLPDTYRFETNFDTHVASADVEDDPTPESEAEPAAEPETDPPADDTTSQREAPMDGGDDNAPRDGGDDVVVAAAPEADTQAATEADPAPEPEPEATQTALAFEAVKSADGTVTVTGTVPGNSSDETLRATLGPNADIDLTIAEDVNDAAWTNAIDTGLQGLTLLDAGRLIANGNALTLEGTTSAAATAEFIDSQQGQLEGDYTLTASIDIAQPVANFTFDFDAARGIEVNGNVPQGVDFMTVQEAVSVRRILGNLTIGAPGDAEAMLEQITNAATRLDAFETAQFSIDADGLRFAGQALEGADTDALLTEMQAALPDADVTVETSSASFEAGATRTDVLSGEEKTFRNGAWVAAQSFVRTLPNCQARVDSQIQDGQISFLTASADIDPAARATLNALFEVLAYCLEDLDFNISIDGHTDNVGAADANEQLSADRAQSVADALQALGISQDRLITRGLGETEPVASNDTEDGRAANRRTEIRLIGN
jgi:OOP family OmpA-OmpF porin